MLRHVRNGVLAFAFAISAAAQSPTQNWDSVKALTAGQSVRVIVGSRSVSGQLQVVTDDSLAVAVGKDSQVFTKQDVTRVSVKKQGHRGRNALIGLGVGAAAGAGSGALSHGSSTSTWFGSRGQWAAGGAAVFGVLGAIVGALIPTGGWHDVYKQ